MKIGVFRGHVGEWSRIYVVQMLRIRDNTAVDEFLMPGVDSSRAAGLERKGSLGFGGHFGSSQPSCRVLVFFWLSSNWSLMSLGPPVVLFDPFLGRVALLK